MNKEIKEIKSIKKEGEYASTQGGFLEIIVIILIALLIMKYYGITISEALYWFKNFFGDVLR